MSARKNENRLMCVNGQYGDTCFNKESAEIIIAAYNERSAHAKTMRAVRDGLKCDTDRCVIEKMKVWDPAPGVKDRLSAAEIMWIGKQHTLPLGPVGDEWLSNRDIDNYMMSLIDYIYYVDTVSRDHKKINSYPSQVNLSDIMRRPRIRWEKMTIDQICEAIPELKDYKNRKEYEHLFRISNLDFLAGVYKKPGLTAPHRKAPIGAETAPPPRCFGIGINLDSYRGPGTHWVCIFVDCRSLPFQVIYYDSAGRAPHNDILDYMCDIIVDLAPVARKEAGLGPDDLPPIEVKYNNIVHQLENNECGMYVISVLEDLSKNNISFDAVCARRNRDDKVNGLRRRTFVSPKSI